QVRREAAGRVHGRAADRAGEQAEERDRGTYRDGGVVPDAPVPGGGVQDHAEDDLHDERTPVPAWSTDRVRAARGHMAEHDLEEEGTRDRPRELGGPVGKDPGRPERLAAGEGEGYRR